MTEYGELKTEIRTISPVTAGHFIFIPAVMLVGIVIGWILGSRAARDAYMAELRRREQKAQKAQKSNGESEVSSLKSQGG